MTVGDRRDIRRRGPAADDPGPELPAGEQGGEESLLEAEVHRFEHEARRLAAGGWRRALIGLALGAALGLAVLPGLPRDRGS